MPSQNVSKGRRKILKDSLKGPKSSETHKCKISIPDEIWGLRHKLKDSVKKNSLFTLFFFLHLSSSLCKINTQLRNEVFKAGLIFFF